MLAHPGPRYPQAISGHSPPVCLFSFSFPCSLLSWYPSPQPSNPLLFSCFYFFWGGSILLPLFFIFTILLLSHSWYGQPHNIPQLLQHLFSLTNGRPELKRSFILTFKVPVVCKIPCRCRLFLKSLMHLYSIFHAEWKRYVKCKTFQTLQTI